MNATEREIAELMQQPTLERVAGLKRIVQQRDIQAVLKQSGQAQRRCRRLPPWFMVWFVIALALFCCDSHRQVFRWLQPFRRRGTPGRSTLCEARKRLGAAPLRLLTERIVQLQATPETPGAFYQGMRLMAIDSFIVNLPDSDRNARTFGYPQGGRSQGANPQARVLGLCEVGTHVFYRASIKPCRRGEVPMAGWLLRFLQENMLLLWDRNFLSFETLGQVLEAKAHLLARIRSTLIFKPIRRLQDGSFLAKLYRTPYDRKIDRGGVKVRIIEYTFRDPGRPGSGEKHRLLTTLLDARVHPAKRLIELYHERWEEELAIDELKTHQLGRPTLRSETPAGVVQEIYGLLLGHYVVRKIMVEAGKSSDVSPRRLSFVETLKILRCRLPESPKSPGGQRQWFDRLLEEVAAEVLPERRDRVNPRVIKRKMSKWHKKRPQHRHYPQPTLKFRKGIEILN